MKIIVSFHHAHIKDLNSESLTENLIPFFNFTKQKKIIPIPTYHYFL